MRVLKLLPLLTALLLLQSKSFAQEIISNLEFNPSLYYATEKYRQAQQNMKTGVVNGDYLFLPDTLELPFIDDFSKNFLATFEPQNFVFDTVNRSEDLGSTINFYEAVKNPTYTYTADTITKTIDSVLNVADTLILNDDANDPRITTDTMVGWPPTTRLYYEINPAGPDTILRSQAIPIDTVIRYTVFQLVRDTGKRWLNNYACINNTYPIEPLSFGVATLDGLNQFGIPHNNWDGATYGPADTLTSAAIDLLNSGGIGTAYLSFVVQPGGNGDWPNATDSLILEFNNGFAWEKVWDTAGFDAQPQIDSFAYVEVPIVKPAFIREDFQFRFRNYASINGNNDHWHLDYVHLEKDSTARDSIIRDFTIKYPNPLSALLNRYTSMPWNQFEGFENIEAQPAYRFLTRNNGDAAENVRPTFRIYEKGGDTILSLPTPPNLELQPFSDSLAPGVAQQIPIPFTVTTDTPTIVIRPEITPSPVGGRNLTTENDTVLHEVIFSNYFAYDDGSAEKAYGLGGVGGLKKFAYRFELNEPDTLRAIAFGFTQINFDARNELFSVFAWKDLDIDNVGQEEDTIWFTDFQRPVFTGVKNGFHEYRLDSPVIVEGTIYIGWSQLGDNNIQVGMDVNNSAQDNMFFNVGGQWFQSQVPGAPLIRPLLGKALPPITSITEPRDLPEPQAVKLFPNPASQQISFELSNNWNQATIEVFDLTGKRVLHKAQTHSAIDISGLKQGVYLIRIRDDQETIYKPARFIKL